MSSILRRLGVIRGDVGMTDAFADDRESLVAQRGEAEDEPNVQGGQHREGRDPRFSPAAARVRPAHPGPRQKRPGRERRRRAFVVAPGPVGCAVEVGEVNERQQGWNHAARQSEQRPHGSSGRRLGWATAASRRGRALGFLCSIREVDLKDFASCADCLKMTSRRVVSLPRTVILYGKCAFGMTQGRSSGVVSNSLYPQSFE